MGFPNEALPPPNLCSPKHGAACPTGALHNRRGAVLRERFRAAAYAVCRRRFAARRRGFAERKDVLTVCRGFRGLRKIFLRALAPARPVRRAPFPVRSATGTLRIRRGARAWENASFERGAAGESQKGLPARDGRHLPPGAAPLLRSLWAASSIGRKARLRPDSPSRLPMRKAGKKRFSARAGAAAGRLRAVDRGLRNSSAGGGHGMRRVMKKYGLSSRAVRFFPIVRRAVSPGLHNITNEMKNRTILRLPFDRLGGGLRV